MRLRRLLAAAVLAALPLPALAQGKLDPADVARIDAVFEDWARPEGPGCSVAVYKAGEVLLAKGYGAANVEHAVPISADTVFDLGSTSKHVTASCIALLAVEGKLSLDDPIRKHVPKLPDWGDRVTIRHCLHHVGGLRDYVALLLFSGRKIQDRTTVGDALEVLGRQKGLCFEPGTKRQYSNTGYFLLSQVVEGASKLPLAKYAKAKFFDPLGMTSTLYLDDCTLVVPRRATAYGRKGAGFLVDMSDWEQCGDGAVQTSVLDFAKWVRNLETAAVGGAAWRELMFSKGRMADGKEIPYGFGLAHGDHRGRREVGHGGAWAGFRAILSMLPEEELAVVVLANRADADCGERAAKVLDVLVPAAEAAAKAEPEPEPPPEDEPAKGPEPTDAELAALAGTFRSDEAAVTWTVAVEKRLVRVSGPNAPRRALPWRGSDRFGGLRFERDAAGAPVRFVIEFPGLEGVAFERLAR